MSAAAESSILIFGHGERRSGQCSLGAFELSWVALPAPGKEVSEDALFAAIRPNGSLGAGVLDGMGGMIDGGAAARTGVEVLRDGVEAGVGALRDALLDGLERGHRHICEQFPGAGATAVVAAVDEGGAQLIHAGDAEGFLVDFRGQLLQRTVPDSPVGMAFACGALTEAEALAHPDRNLVGSGLGVEGMTMRLGARQPLSPGRTLILASDGLTDNIFQHELIHLAGMKSLTEAAESLAALAEQRMARPLEGPEGRPIGKPDDLTVLTIRPA